MTTTTEAMRLAREALAANDQWHKDHDDHDGYPGSELAEQNAKAIAAIDALPSATQYATASVAGRNERVRGAAFGDALRWTIQACGAVQRDDGVWFGDSATAKLARVLWDGDRWRSVGWSGQRLHDVLHLERCDPPGRDQLQGAADWLCKAIDEPGPSVLQRHLLIGYNRAERLFAQAMASAA